MSNMIVKFMKLDERAVIPKYHTEGSSGFDLYTIEQTVIPPRGTKLISTGLCADIPKGYEIQIRPRSGNSLKTAIRISNSPGTLDCMPLSSNILVDENRNYTSLKDILEGKVNEILTYNIEEEKLETQTVKDVFPAGKKKVYCIELENGKKIRVSDGQLVFTSEGWIKAKDMKLGDEVFNY